MLSSKIKNINYIGKLETYDITVNSKDHIYYANNIATSNSHSYSYAVVGYQTAWVKAHFPREYICAWLKIAKNEQKPLEEIRAMMSEARRLGIKVYGPSFRNLPKTDFFIDENDVYFGLSSIKGCSEDAFARLNCSDINFKKIGWTEFLIKYSYLLKQNQIIPMIKVGVFDDLSLKSRFECIYEYQQWSELTATNKNKVMALFDSKIHKNLKDIVKEYINTDPKNVEKYIEIYQALVEPPSDLNDHKKNLIEHEKELLGINITCSHIERMVIPPGTSSCKSLDNIKGDKYKVYSVVGEIVDFQEFKIKNGKLAGQVMANLSVEDQSGELSVVVFPEALDQFQAALYEGNTVLIKGKKSDRGGLVLNEIYEV